MRSIWMSAWALAVFGGCGTQASEGYSGESLLRMQGSVTVDTLSATPDSVPALCFMQTTWPGKFRRDRLPEAIQTAIENGGSGPMGAVFHIVDVETHGRFPAEFDVDVHVPPPAAALERLAPGEPLATFGNVCAVAPEHPATAQDLLTFSITKSGIEPPYSFDEITMRVTRDGSRYYAKHEVCASAADKSTCQVSREGDATLLREASNFESVYGLAENVQVVYLSEPAPKGSYTAYRAVAPDGLAAGYHVRPAYQGFIATPAEGCLNRVPWDDKALAETNALHGTNYDGLPVYYGADGNPHLAPPDVLDDFNRIHTRLEMEACPIENLAVIGDPSADLSIDLRAKAPHLFD